MKQIAILSLVLIVAAVGIGWMTSVVPPRKTREVADVPQLRGITASSRKISAPTNAKNAGRETVTRGKVVSLVDATIAAPLSGRIAKRQVAVGSRVHEGDALLEFDETPLADRLREAGANERRAESRLEDARQQWLRTRQGSDAAATTEAVNRYWMAHATLEAARQQTAAAKQTLGRRVVRAPVAGVVAECHVEPSEYFHEGDALLRIIEPRQVKVVVALPPALASRLAVRNKSREPFCSVRGGDGTWRAAEVVQVAPVADKDTGLITVEMRPLQDDVGLRAGMLTDVRIGSTRSTVRQIASKPQ